jgi:NSS family neurotransmitter:Na+ symporter
VFSFSSWENVYPLGNFEIFANKTPFDLIDYMVSNVLMPIGGILYAIFAGWWVSKELLLEEIGVGDGAMFQVWLLLARVVAPLAVATIFIFNLV